ncbi:MAG: RAMP superfamily CRISPR-associated protein [Fidelibacterota bacterium]
MDTYVKPYQVFACSTDPVYIGTGGYTIGRVDNTIVRDPITRIPKIPGSSVCGTWRYFMMLQLQSYFQDNFNSIKMKIDPDSEEKNVKSLVNRKADKDLGENEKSNFGKRKEKFEEYVQKLPGNGVWQKMWGNLISSMNCAGQDELPNESYEQTEQKSKDKFGHCGHCIVCKTFGFSKQDRSGQGLAAFTDLNILFFPVYTRLGTRWITSEQILLDAGLISEKTENLSDEKIAVSERDGQEKYLNLGWLNAETQKRNTSLDRSNCNGLDDKDIIIVPDSLIAQIINSNLEVRTSVAIDPNTGAAKEGALFTSEAIPRATWFYGKVNLFNRPGNDLDVENIFNALKDSKHYYETLGIGGMTTRGFGRMKMLLTTENTESTEKKNEIGI